jgi:flagellar biogenesis protein FliO
LALAAPLVALGVVIFFLWLAMRLIRQLFGGESRPNS